MKTWLTAAAFAWAFAAAIFLLVWPVYSGFDGVRASNKTLLEVNGLWAAVPVGFPVVVAAAALAFRRRAVTIAAAVVLGLFCLIAGFSIGMFYVPAAVTMVVAACVTKTDH